MHASIPPAVPQDVLPPLLAALPSSALSTQPPDAILPVLSPILRQRVRILSSTADDPWLPLLCYDSSSLAGLQTAAQSDLLVPHPASGEIELDWDHDVALRYRRLDVETLHAIVLLNPLALRIRLVWCVGDPDGFPDAWRVGEVTVDDGRAAPARDADLSATVAEAEARFKTATATRTHGLHSPQAASRDELPADDSDDDDDDAAYWAQYDHTPARTPALKRSPAPDALRHHPPDADAEEDAYFAQYAQVQPALDNHDPDEAAAQGAVASTLGGDAPPDAREGLTANALAHPRPSSSSGSAAGASPASEDAASTTSSAAVARLEQQAAQQDRAELAVKQHISTSVKSLYRLARVAGVEREEFERLVRTELDMLGMMEREE